MLAKASKVISDHVNNMTDKNKAACCVSGKQAHLKENLNPGQNTPHLSDAVIVDSIHNTTYIKGRLLGRGGFARCYELKDQKTGKIYAGKIISKSRLAKPHQIEKIRREVELHRPLKHTNVVGFHSYFEDKENVYIVIEYCSRKSLVHILRARYTVTEAETRYFLKQLCEGTEYVHSKTIVHRDLKLGNMLLNDNMHVKIADFGLATRIDYVGEKKMTVCGTPNYIAPEVLQRKGHSYEADIWALGCIMYALLVGKPPFETSSLRETYLRISANKYEIPSHISAPAKSLIQKLLSADPLNRPTLHEILLDSFMTSGHLPKSLSTSCCEYAPKFNVKPIPQRPKSYAAPVSSEDAMIKITNSIAQIRSKRAGSPSPVRNGFIMKSTETLNVDAQTVSSDASSIQSNRRSCSTPNIAANCRKKPAASCDAKNISTQSLGSTVRLYQMLSTCLEQMPQDSNPSPVHDSKPMWVTKWVDYSNKYGFGFQLSDKRVGVLFNDTTRILLAGDGRTVQYNDLSNKIYTFTLDQQPREYKKKTTLLLYFAQYMDEHLIHGGDLLHNQNQQIGAAIFMKKWFRTERAIVMYLNNGTLQVNFFEDHTKIIISAENQDYLLTFINSQRQSVNYRLLQIRHFGCHADIVERLKYARDMMEGIINIKGEAV